MPVFNLSIFKSFLITIFSLAFSLVNFRTLAQTHFKYDLRKANPVDEKSTLSIKDKINVHDAYLKKAILNKNLTEQFYGHLFLFVDYYKGQDYVKVTKHLIQADSIAREFDNKSWQGAIYMRKGAMSDAVNHNYQEAIRHYEMAVKFCTQARDSLCVGESLEQLSSMYGFLEKYDSAHYFYSQALPLLQKFADKQQMATTYNNFSNLLAFEKHFSDAIRYVDSAISIARANKDIYKEMMYLNNKASDYADMGQYDKAIGIYQNCVRVNVKNNWTDRLVRNYTGLFEAFEKKGDYRSAFEHLKTFYEFKDSLSGEGVQLKIADLNTRFDIQAKELALKKSQLELIQANHSLVKRNFLIFLIFLLSTAGLLIWQWQYRKNKNELKQNRENLLDLTKNLLEKNTLLTGLVEQLNEQSANNIPSPGSMDFENNLYNQRILTDADWFAFKNHFEKAYPGYLKRLRIAYADITEAEERLFLFIKLNLKSKESAAILGISVDSVKKTRNRLRKRLALSEVVDLDEYVKNF